MFIFQNNLSIIHPKGNYLSSTFPVYLSGRGRGEGEDGCFAPRPRSKGEGDDGVEGRQGRGTGMRWGRAGGNEEWTPPVPKS
jgi:hypothetical protein